MIGEKVNDLLELFLHGKHMILTPKNIPHEMFRNVDGVVCIAWAFIALHTVLERHIMGCEYI